MARRTGDKYTRIMSLIFLGFVLVVLWISAPLLVPVWSVVATVTGQPLARFQATSGWTAPAYCGPVITT